MSRKGSKRVQNRICKKQAGNYDQMNSIKFTLNFKRRFYWATRTLLWNFLWFFLHLGYERFCRKCNVFWLALNFFDCLVVHDVHYVDHALYNIILAVHDMFYLEFHVSLIFWFVIYFFNAVVFREASRGH